MAKNLMIQGTMSGVGKSILTAGILRVLRQDGFRCAPFKSQNMALNSFVTEEGREIGRAQALQAAAAGVKPSADMNPILLKPLGEKRSSLVLLGKPEGNYTAAGYFRKKREYLPLIREAYERLAKEADIVVIEGAGSPVEINLRENDIVNMGLAKLLDAPVLLVGNIDPGGVFAQLLGTIELMAEEERARIRGLVINKFRGDLKLLSPGLTQFQKWCSIPFAGVVPFLSLSLDEEDSLSDRLHKKPELFSDCLKLVVVRFPYISNCSDFTVLDQTPGVEVIYTEDPDMLECSDLIILPGTRRTIEDLKWMREKGLSDRILMLHKQGCPILGICGGFQMLGRTISDEAGAETGGSAKGLSLLPTDTRFREEKKLCRTEGRLGSLTGFFAPLSDTPVKGYEVHLGDSGTGDRLVVTKDHVLGTFLHGFFDSAVLRERLLKILFKRKGKKLPPLSLEEASVRQEKELDHLAKVLRESLDWELIYRSIGV